MKNVIQEPSSEYGNRDEGIGVFQEVFFAKEKYDFDNILVAIRRTSEGQILRSGKSGSRNYWPLAFSEPPAKRLNYIMCGYHKYICQMSRLFSNF